jgi:Anaphase-promoting complex, subunit 10 (APC10)
MLPHGYFVPHIVHGHRPYKEQRIDYIAGPTKLVTDLPDIGHLAKWSVSSHKFGFGSECLRDDDPETFWQCVLLHFIIWRLTYSITLVW